MKVLFLLPSYFLLLSFFQLLPNDDRAFEVIRTLEDRRDVSAAELTVLTDAARGRAGDRVIGLQAAAIRALGRLERRDVIPVLLELAQAERTRPAASVALIVTLRAHGTRPGDSEVESAVNALLALTTSSLVVAHLPYTTAAQVELAETKLMALAGDPATYAGVSTAFEVLARRHRRLHQLGEDTVRFLTRAAGRTLPGQQPADHHTPRRAMAALMASGRADEAVVGTVLRDADAQVRRTGVAALNSAGRAVNDEAAPEMTRAALRDPSHIVRYEALLGWSRRHTARHGCAPIVAALADGNLHVVLAALDALAERCRDDEDITTRLASESRTPPTVGEWHREAHALVALAARAPERAAIAMASFMSHPVSQVRMYAARAAAAMKDAASLERLAYDSHDNVREAALAPLRALKAAESDAAFVAALTRSDYQLLRTAALTLAGTSGDKHLAAALAEALQRVTADRKETSRDTRLALIERLRAVGGPEQLGLYERLLRDFDPRVAEAAAAECGAISGRICVPAPQPLPRPAADTRAGACERVKALLELEGGRRFEIVFRRDLAPLACARFVRLGRAHYYDGLTFHRVAPNFVIQGGGPGANEYSGDGPFMRDELGGSHLRGTVGISTRGRDTGDAQIFVNLVDNPRLDFEYTVFGDVPERHMATVVDAIQEGARIVRINFVEQAP
jgi:cyclophilin family peptidyl-prolyl cis-trans isomerase